MTKTNEAIKHWSAGLVTTDEMIQTAKKEGYRLEREGEVIHATKFGASFSRRIG